ncbi:hypothetical protein B0H13DRAFT_2367459 [Mycena leptocephala]|nr:hypothetical protein B0H13DRAFT_2367459 [Mycena leptocephala]
MTQFPSDTVAPAATSAAAATVPPQDTTVANTVASSVDTAGDTAAPQSDSPDPAAAPGSAAAGPATPANSAGPAAAPGAAAATPASTPAAATGLCMTAPWVAGAIYGVVPGGPLTLVAENGSSDTWYAITKGRYVGVTNSTAIADGAVTRVSNALRTSYGSQAEAVQAFNQALSMPFLELNISTCHALATPSAPHDGHPSISHHRRINHVTQDRPLPQNYSINYISCSHPSQLVIRYRALATHALATYPSFAPTLSFHLALILHISRLPPVNAIRLSSPMLPSCASSGLILVLFILTREICSPIRTVPVSISFIPTIMSNPPPPYARFSPDDYMDDAELDALIANLSDLDLSVLTQPSPIRPQTPPGSRAIVPVTPTRPTGRLYEFHSPTRSGITPEWLVVYSLRPPITSERLLTGPRPVISLKASLRVESAQLSYRLQARVPKIVLMLCSTAVYPGAMRSGNYAPLHIFFDLQLMIPRHGPQGAHIQVTRVSGAVSQGYQSMAEARAAYDYAYIRNWTGVRGLPAPRQVRAIEALPLPILPDDPTPNPLHGAAGAGAHRWHIVYAGITPGIYLSFLEAALNTQGISGSRYDSATTLHEARRRWGAARAANSIEVLTHPYY